MTTHVLYTTLFFIVCLRAFPIVQFVMTFSTVQLNWTVGGEGLGSWAETPRDTVMQESGYLPYNLSGLGPHGLV